MRLFGRGTEQIESLPDGPWSVREGVYEGRPMVLRLNTGLADHVGHRHFAVRVGMAVRFNRPDDRGYPSGAETAALDGFEEQFVDRFCGTNATLAAVITTGGMREFVFYCRDEQVFRGRFREWALTPKTHRVQMIVARDPSWDVYRALERTSDVTAAGGA